MFAKLLAFVLRARFPTKILIENSSWNPKGFQHVYSSVCLFIDTAKACVPTSRHHLFSSAECSKPPRSSGDISHRKTEIAFHVISICENNICSRKHHNDERKNFYLSNFYFFKDLILTLDFSSAYYIIETLLNSLYSKNRIILFSKNAYFYSVYLLFHFIFGT